MSTSSRLGIDLSEENNDDGIEASGSYKGLLVGEVIDNQDPILEGRVKVFVSKLMPDKSQGEAPVNIKYTITNRNIQNSYTNSTGLLNEVNGFWVRPFCLFESGDPNWYEKNTLKNSGSLRIPRIGTKVLIYFIDGDQSKGYYFPYSPTFDGDKMSSQFGSKTWNDPTLQPNIDLIRKYWNEMRIEADTNNQENSLAFTVVQQQDNKPTKIYNRIKIEDNEVNKKISVIHANNHSIIIDPENITVIFNTSGSTHTNDETLGTGHIVRLNNDKIELLHSGGTSMTLTSSKVTIVGNTRIEGGLSVAKDVTTDKGISHNSHTHGYHHGETSSPH